MTGFSSINKIHLPYSCIEEVYKHLQKAGQRGMEGVALWAGTHSETTFKVIATIIPKQEAYRHETGLLYTVDGEELHRVNVWLYQNKMSLIAQVHSHPREAYHSETDDAYPIITIVGGISIVIPDFGFHPISVEDWAVYRLTHQIEWEELSSDEVGSLIKVIS